MKTNTCYINLLQNRGNAIVNLNNFLKQDNGESYAKVVKLLNKNPQLKYNILGNLFVKQIQNNYPYYLDSVSLEKILLWNCYLINEYAPIIVDFSKKKDTFEKLFLSAKFTEAYEICREIREEYGCSMWLLDAYGLLDTYSNIGQNIEKDFDDLTLDYYNILLLKNKKTERQTQYINRINRLLANISEPLSSYYKYKLFSDMPFGYEDMDKKWRSIIWVENSHSLIDIYLATIDCLQYYINDRSKRTMSIFKHSIGLIASVDTPICQIVAAIFNDKRVNQGDGGQALKYTELMQRAEYSKIVDIYLEEGLGGDNGFNVCRYAATAALHHDAQLDLVAKSLGDEIFIYTYNILKKNNDKVTHESVSLLTSIARILRSFTIHKGICVFLDVQLNICFKYYFAQQVCTYSDDALLLFEINNEIIPLLPHKVLYSESNNITQELPIIEKNASEFTLAQNYYETAIVKNNVVSLMTQDNISEAVSEFIYAYIKNPFLVYCIDLGKIPDYLDNKIRHEEKVSLEELCFIFIDAEYKEYRSSCFLNFLDSALIDEPLKILGDFKYREDCVQFFLAKICSVEMLISLYTLFDSTDQAEDYRIEICKVLAKAETPYTRELKIEMEELTKNKALQQRLINVDRSRVSIDTSKIQEDVSEDIEYQMGICNAQLSQNISSQNNETYLIINPKTDAYLCMYETYAKMFCFSQSGLDTSLSTRVRHGAFENQIFRNFTENCLIYNDGNNSFFEPLLKNGTISNDLKPFLLSLQNEVQNKLQYFTQHTLKVFMDEPIEGAVFDYSAKCVGEEGLDLQLLLSLVFGSISTANDAIKMLHKLLIDKTNHYLELIRTKYLPDLESDLISALDDFSKKYRYYVSDANVKREIERRITRCKTALQSEFETVAGWFYLSEYEEWEDYNFAELLGICLEITKKLFVGFDRVRINTNIDERIVYSGKTFRSNTDILSILLNNAFIHSGFQESPDGLTINCELKMENDSVCFEVENNLNTTIDIDQLTSKVTRINMNYLKGEYNNLNTRQEGGMGLYKIMSILHKTMKTYDAFYMSVDDHKVKVRIKLPKEYVCDEKNTISG